MEKACGLHCTKINNIGVKFGNDVILKNIINSNMSTFFISFSPFYGVGHVILKHPKSHPIIIWSSQDTSNSLIRLFFCASVNWIGYIAPRFVVPEDGSYFYNWRFGPTT